MKRQKRLGVLHVAGVFLRKKGEVKRVKTADLSSTERSWNGKLIEIRELRDGTSQVKRLV